MSALKPNTAANPPPDAAAPLLKVRDLRTALGEGPSPVRAVDGVDFEIRRGETFALLGESGCGKSMTALSIMRLLPPSGPDRRRRRAARRPRRCSLCRSCEMRRDARRPHRR